MKRWLARSVVFLFVYGGCATTSTHDAAVDETPQAFFSAEDGWAHAPYATGECGLCHARNDHANPGLVRKPIRTVCLSCHDEFGETMTVRLEKHGVGTDCTSCHDPHQGNDSRLLRASVDALCTSCHTGVTLAHNERGEHGAACNACHDPHIASDTAVVSF